MANQMIEKIETDGAKAVWRMYQATNGVISGLPVLSADEDRITRTLTTKYCNGATGTAITDGLDVGIAGDGTAEIRQRENLPLVLYTNNQSRITIDANGRITLSSLAGTGKRAVVADSTGNLSTDDCYLNLATGNNVPIKVVKNISLVNNNFSDLFNFYSSGGFSSANYMGGVTGELKIKVIGLNSSYTMVDSYRTFLISAKQQANGNITIVNITPKDTLDTGVIPTVTVRGKTGNTNVSAKIEIAVTFPNFLECSILAEIECLSMSNLTNNLIKIN